MSYSYNEKIEVKAAKLSIEILGVFPKSQPVISNISGENVYNVRINGVVAQIRESSLDALVASGTIEQIIEKTVDMEVQETVANHSAEGESVSESVIPEIKKRGRRPKI